MEHKLGTSLLSKSVDLRHELYIYRSTYWAPGEYVIDCEEHSISMHTPWFFDALGRALLHRQAAIR